MHWQVWPVWFSALALISALNAAPFNDDWRFLRADPEGAHRTDWNDADWERVTLPHTPRIEALVCGRDAPQWQGVCWYRKHFFVPAAASNRVAILRFEGAMNTAQIWVNGRPAGTFMGGYLPYVLDLSRLLQPGATNLLAVRLDNRDNPLTGPKPLADLDFNLYGGLYRGVSLTFKDPLHITDPILADRVASGGVFVTFPQITATAAVVRVQTHLRNSDGASRAFGLRATMADADGNAVASDLVAGELPARGEGQWVQELTVAQPRLWSPASPHLYRVRVEVLAGGRVLDLEQLRVGIRRVDIRPEGLFLNGERRFLRGVNRHQEYPWIGNALSDAAQYRDALKIKEAGFDYVRLSHYPQSPAFLDACDELGLLVMNCILGWQYFNPDPAFAALKLRECRELVRRDRNHPSVVLWEVSLNESDQPAAFIAAAHAAAHEEFPGQGFFTCGWQPGYDVFLQARQHGGCRGITNRPCVVSEYGDWEYFAQNAGLEQHLWKNLAPAERSSRQRRGEGETRLLQQALNFQEAHNDNLGTRAFADGLWVMFDYNRGYAPDIEASGCMDIFRLPKFAWWFYRSQRDADEPLAGQPLGPVLFIASWNTENSPRPVRVFSNCEEVELFCNERSLGRRKPDTDRVSIRLRHPPFTFALPEFAPGTLRAVGYRNGRAVASHLVRTPQTPERLVLWFDLAGKPFAAEGKDMVFCHAEVRDAHGTLVPTNGLPVSFGAVGPVQLLGPNPMPTEAGVASRLLQSDVARPRCAVFALALVVKDGGLQPLVAAACPDAVPPPEFALRYATNGGPPTAQSPLWRGPLPPQAAPRIGVFVGESLVVQAHAASGQPLAAQAGSGGASR
jgi:beta-galactosidase